MDYDNVPEEYKPLGMWSYFLWQILFAIPIVGFILLIIQALAAKNKNLKNFARSYFCFLIIVIVLFVILWATGTVSNLVNH
jgi:hypothetical protein